MSAPIDPLLRRRDWSELPQELLIEIFSKLSWTCLRYKSVCKTWRSAIFKYFSPPLAKSYPKPWLLLPPSIIDEKNNCLKFYSPDSPKLHKQNAVPKRFYSSKIIGCSFSCLIMLDADMSLYLFNPLTLEQIQLEPIETDTGFSNASRCNAILSDDPWGKKNNFIVVIIIELKDSTTRCRLQLGFLNPRDKNWVWFGKIEGYIKDICFHDGRLYVVSPDRTSIWILNNSVMVKVNEVMTYEPDICYEYVESVIKLYGEIHRIKFRLQDGHITKLYKLEFPSDGGCRWIETSMESLKTHVFLCDALHVMPLPTYYVFDGVLNSNWDFVSCTTNTKSKWSLLPLWIVPQPME